MINFSLRSYIDKIIKKSFSNTTRVISQKSFRKKETEMKYN